MASIESEAQLPAAYRIGRGAVQAGSQCPAAEAALIFGRSGGGYDCRHSIWPAGPTAMRHHALATAFAAFVALAGFGTAASAQPASAPAAAPAAPTLRLSAQATRSVALDEMVDRLAEDHANARLLAQGLAAIDGVLLDPDLVQTNIVYFDVDPSKLDASSLSAALLERGVLINPTGTHRLRAVTNYQVSAADVETVLGAIEEVLAGGQRTDGASAAMLYR